MVSHRPCDIILWTALVTPFTDVGKIDFDSLQRLVQRQNMAGNGILALGSTGESLALSHVERYEVLRCIMEYATDVPVMAGVGGFQLDTQITWCHEAANLGVDAFLMVTPMYVKPGINGQAQWFCRLMDAVEQPCMLYNVPTRTGTSLHTQSIQLLCDHQQFWAIKDSSGDPHVAKSYQQMHHDVAIYCGDDNLMPAYSEIGACGCVSVASNLWPQSTKQYIQQCLEKTLDDAANRQWQTRSKALFVTSNPIPIKAALKAQQFIVSDYVRLPLSSADMPTLPSILNKQL